MAAWGYLVKVLNLSFVSGQVWIAKEDCILLIPKYSHPFVCENALLACIAILRRIGHVDHRIDR